MWGKNLIEIEFCVQFAKKQIGRVTGAMITKDSIIVTNMYTKKKRKEAIITFAC